MARVPTKLKLAEILGKMFVTDMHMSSADGALHQGPETFDALGMVLTVRPLLCAMIDGAVKITKPSQLRIGQQFIRRDLRAIFDVFDDMWLKRLTTDVRHNARNHIAIALDHSEHDRLAGSAAAALTAAPLAANHHFIRFDVAAQLVVAVNLREILADFMAHTPSRLIGDAQLALQFLRRNAMARGREQIHRVKPFLERNARATEWRADHRMNVIAAVARICRHFGKLTKLPDFSTALTFDAFAVTLFEKMRQTGVIIWELGEELLNCDRHALLHCGDFGTSSYIRQADNHQHLFAWLCMKKATERCRRRDSRADET